MDYTNYDYDALVQRLTELVKEQEGWGNGYNSSMGQTIIQNVSFIVDNLHYMLERRSMENFSPTARLPSSVKSIAHAHGYRPRRRVSARGPVTLHLQDDDGNEIEAEGEIFIPKFTPVFSQGENFLVNEDVEIAPGDTEATFEIVEGLFKTRTVDPDGDNEFNEYNHIMFDDYESIEEGSIEVSSGGEEFFDVVDERDDLPPIEALSFAEPSDRVYDLRIFNEGMAVVFGNGTFGIRPDSPVTVNWIESSGSDVNIQAIGLEFELEDNELQDNVNVTPPNTYSYTITNDESISGGLEEESVEDVKLRSPEFIRSSNRAITKEDFEFWAKRSGIGGIVDAFAYGEEEIGITVFNMNNVYLTYLTQQGEPYTQSEEEAFRRYMSNLMPITTHLVLDSAEEIPLQITLRVQRHPDLEITNSELYTITRNLLVDYFSIDSETMKKNFYHSRLNSELHNKTIVRGGRTFRLFQYVYMDVKPLKPFSVPSQQDLYYFSSSYDIEITAGTDGDVYSLVLEYTNEDNEPQQTTITYEQTSGDDADAITSELATQIDALDGINATATTNQLSLEPQYSAREIGISNHGSTVPANIPVLLVVTLPPRLFKNEDEIELFTKGSIEILNGTYPYAQIGEDDGNGTVTVNGSTGTINYVTGEMILPVYEGGDYLVRYQQDNDEENVFTNPTTYVGYSRANEDGQDAQDELSTIEIL